MISDKREIRPLSGCKCENVYVCTLFYPCLYFSCSARVCDVILVALRSGLSLDRRCFISSRVISLNR